MGREKSCKYQAVAIGASAGGLAALGKLLPAFDAGCRGALLVVQHLAPDSSSYLIEHFRKLCIMDVREARDKETIMPGAIYFAPPNYHLLVEHNRCLALSTQDKVNFSRPSIDMLFETAAEAYGSKLVGVILTGANSDGSRGLAAVKRMGGLTIVQSPIEAEVDIMPKAAIAATQVDRIFTLDEMSRFLSSLDYTGGE